MNLKYLKSLFTIIVCMSIALTTVIAQDFSNQKAKVPVDPKVKAGTLANGLKYYIMENKTPEKYARFRLVVKAGSINEDDDQHGLAHFTEHMAFNGTKHYPKNQLLDFLQKTGLRFGADINAGTGLDQTMYELPMNIENPEMIAKAIEILEDWAHNISYEESQIDSERGVIVSEFRQGNTSNFRILNKLNQYMYYNSKYAKRNIIGDTNLLWHFPYSAIKRFYNDWYRPNLMAVVAVGDFNAAEVEKLIVKQFSGLKNPDKIRENITVPVPGHKQVIVGIAKDKETQYDIGRIIFKLPKFDNTTIEGLREKIKRSLFNRMLAARLAEIQNKPEPPFSAGGASEGEFAGDKRSFSAFTVNQNGDFLKGFKGMLTELFRAYQHGFTATEYERVKTGFISAFEQAYNDRNKRQTDEYVDELTSNFTDDVPVPGIDYSLSAAKYFLNDIKLDEINKLSKMYMTKENCVITLATADKEGVKAPEEKEILAIFNAAWDSKVEPYVDVVIDKPLFSEKLAPGKIVEERSNATLGTKEIKLSNGVKVILKKTRFTDDQILIQAYSPGGISLSPDKNYYSAQVATDIVQSAGIGEFDQPSLTKLLTGKQLAVTPSIDELSEGFSGSSSVKDFESALQLIHMYFTQARTDDNSYQSFLSSFKTYLAGKSQNPDNVFEDSILVALSSNHPRRQPITEAYLTGIDQKQATAFFKDRFADAGDFTFVFVGNIDSANINQLIEKYLGSLPGGNRKESWKDLGIRTIKKPVDKKIYLGNQDRSHVRLIINGDFQFTMKDHYILNSLSEVLNIKFDQIIREEKAGVYSGRINSTTQKYPNGEYSIIVDFVCDPNRIDELTNAVKDIMNDLKKNENNDAVMKVKESQAFQYKLYIERNEYWVAFLKHLGSLNENPEILLQFSKWAEELKASDIKDAANKYFNFDRLSRFSLLPEKI